MAAGREEHGVGGDSGHIDSPAKEGAVGIAYAEDDEVEAIEEYEADKRAGRTSYTRIEDIIRRVVRET